MALILSGRRRAAAWLNCCTFSDCGAWLARLCTLSAHARCPGRGCQHSAGTQRRSQLASSIDCILFSELARIAAVAITWVEAAVTGCCSLAAAGDSSSQRTGSVSTSQQASWSGSCCRRRHRRRCRRRAVTAAAAAAARACCRARVTASSPSAASAAVDDSSSRQAWTLTR